MKWQFHGRLMIRRCVQTERLLKTDLSLEKHLQPRLEVAEKYCQVIEAKVWKNESKGYFRITSSWYLPHFHVVREDKEITKVRIVYDSVAIYGGITHNSMLPGPKLNKMFFFNALLRFRSYLVAVVADLTEIWSGGYTSLGFQKSMKRWAWRSMTDDRASLYLAQYVVRQHAEDNRNDHPLAIAIILLQVYVDDIMTSLSTNDEAIKARE